MQINWHMDKWYFRVIRRFGVVFISGGLIALVESLGAFQTGATPEQLLYISAAMGLLTAIEKAIREPTVK